MGVVRLVLLHAVLQHRLLVNLPLMVIQCEEVCGSHCLRGVPVVDDVLEIQSLQQHQFS